jgi:hypothetical protein
MKPSKMFGLVAFAVLIAACCTASSVMAEEAEFCEADETPCSKPTFHIHLEVPKGHKSVLKTNLLTIECNALTLLEVGAPTIDFTFNWGGCTSGCTITEENGPGELNISWEAHETASVVGEFLFHVSCTGMNCRYNGVGLKGVATGPLLSTLEGGEIAITEQTLNKESGTFCPSTSKLTFAVKPLGWIYIHLHS